MARIPKSISSLKPLILLLATGLLFATATAEPAAVIGETTITYQALEQHAKGPLIKLEQERYEILRAGLTELIGDQLVALGAEAKDQTPEQFLADKVEATQPDSALIQKVYNSNEKNFADTPIDEAVHGVSEYLVGQSKQSRYKEVLAALEEQYPPRVSLRPPVLEIGTGGRPSLGYASAPITLIEFSDYECHYCKTAERVIHEVLESYGDKVHFVYRDYPLDFHANARPASQAARCAEQQGRFWAYHKKLMASEDLHEEQYQAIADEVGLDRAKFDACLTSNDFSEAIDRDIADGEAVGVSGTPAFFINGRMISGAQPFARFKELIDQELERIAGE